MFIEILDSLRCIEPHADSWLVGAFDLVDGRDVVTGVLGCPICHAEYPVRDGAVWFSESMPRADAVGDSASEGEAMRIAAFLDLSDGNGFAILTGHWAVHAPIVSGLTPTHLVLLNPPAAIAPAPGLTIVHALDRVPFAARSARGATIDVGASRAVVARTVDVVRPGGRLIGRLSAATPVGVHELAHDETTRVFERDADIPIVSITRR